jgi:hypothetical protein
MEFVKLSHSIRDFETVDVVPSLNHQSNSSLVIIYLIVGYFPEFLSSER